MRKLFLLATAMLIILSPIAFFTTTANGVTDEEKLLSLINKHRQDNGLPTLILSNPVSAVAAGHSQNMHDQNNLNHVLFGKNPSDRLKDAGIGYTAMVENVAFNKGYSDPVQTCFDGWVNSPGHNSNMLSDAVTHAGIGIFHSDARGWWFTYMGIKPAGSQTPDPEEGQQEDTKTINCNLKQGMGTTYTITFTNTGNTKLTLNSSIVGNSKWVTITPASASAQPGKNIVFTAKINAFSDMAPGKYSERIVFKWNGGTTNYDIALTVLENPELAKPEFTISCPPSLTVPFESGAFTWVSFEIENTGNCDINVKASMVSNPYGMARIYPETSFSEGFIKKGEKISAKMMIQLIRTYNLKNAWLTFTFSDKNIKQSCRVELLRGSPSQFYISGPQVIRMDFVGKTKTYNYWITNSGKTKAKFAIGIISAQNSCLSITYQTNGEEPVVEPGKSTLVKVIFKLTCQPLEKQINGYIQCTRTDLSTTNQSTKMHDFRLVK
jgi:hypothetical protein